MRRSTYCGKETKQHGKIIRKENWKKTFWFFSEINLQHTILFDFFKLKIQFMPSISLLTYSLIVWTHLFPGHVTLELLNIQILQTNIFPEISHTFVRHVRIHSLCCQQFSYKGVVSLVIHAMRCPPSSNLCVSHVCFFLFHFAVTRNHGWWSCLLKLWYFRLRKKWLLTGMSI